MKTTQENRVAEKIMEYVEVSNELFKSGQIDREELERRLETARPYIGGKQREVQKA